MGRLDLTDRWRAHGKIHDDDARLGTAQPDAQRVIDVRRVYADAEALSLNLGAQPCTQKWVSIDKPDNCAIHQSPPSIVFVHIQFGAYTTPKR